MWFIQRLRSDKVESASRRLFRRAAEQLESRKIQAQCYVTGFVDLDHFSLCKQYGPFGITAHIKCVAFELKEQRVGVQPTEQPPTWTWHDYVATKRKTL